MPNRNSLTAEELRSRFISNSMTRLKQMEELEAAGSSSDEAISTLCRHFRALAGLGGSYDLPEVSSLAREGESILMARQRGSAPDEDRIRALIASLRNVIESSASTESDDLAALRGERHPEAPRTLDVLVVTGDAELERTLRTTTEIEGITWRRTSSARDAIAQISERTPAGVITEITLDDGDGYEIVEALRASPQGDHAMAIVISSASEFLDKVEAMRCGADAFFERPLNASVIARRVRQLLETHAEFVRYRILAVENDPDQEDFYRVLLESAGYDVEVCTDPGEFEARLAAWRPDLVLLDVDLPGVSGYDLSRWMRQHEAWATLPIIFVTADTPLTSRIESMRAGGDDHLVKPVSPALLLSAVAARIERARFLRSLLERDGLTGLLTHSAFMERLKARFSLSRRSALTSAALAMIDLDHFKRINDLYGHLTGDRVLSTVAALLRRRLRQSDTIGRYGGEEFAVLIDDLNASEAQRLIERLREEFSSVEHEGPDGVRFTVSFSAGIALMSAETRTLEDWISAADQALYSAKGEGRNRVVLV